MGGGVSPGKGEDGMVEGISRPDEDGLLPARRPGCVLRFSSGGLSSWYRAAERACGVEDETLGGGAGGRLPYGCRSAGTSGGGPVDRA